jgi:hypothetical protein
MSRSHCTVSQTQHAFLVAWGRFAQTTGLIEKLEALPLHQKRRTHTPQTKVLEFLVAHLAGLRHLQDISLAAHPLDKDQSVAQAWGREGWADYSGVSRTLSRLTWEEARQIGAVLQAVSQPFLETECQQILAAGARLYLDGDLTGIPVSSTSKTYPNAAFGYMDDTIQLGYQAALVSLESSTFGRLWLSVEHHPGNTLSRTQATALVQAAEQRLGRRPQRRTALLRQRLQTLAVQIAKLEGRQDKQQQALQVAAQQLAVATEQETHCYQTLRQLEDVYETRRRPERPSSQLAKARQQFQAAKGKRQRKEAQRQQAEKRLARTTTRWQEQQAVLEALQARLVQFETDNATNLQPVEAVFRLDAGFGTYENIALLIEMGYEVYIKPCNHKVPTYLKTLVDDQTLWTRVGANAEVVAWSDLQLKGSPYPLDVALLRFYTGKKVRYSALLHFGADEVTTQLTTWFETYNRRQLIEAGIKEGKHVFHLHHLKVRSEPAIYLQEQVVLFAANFIRWATHWLSQQALPLENGLDVATVTLKRQVQVGAHVSAEVVRDTDGWLLTFSQCSAFAGKALKLPAEEQQRWSQQTQKTQKMLVFRCFS